MEKRFILMGFLALMVMAGTAQTAAATSGVESIISQAISELSPVNRTVMEEVIQIVEEQTMLEEQALKAKKLKEEQETYKALLAKNASDIRNVIRELENYVDKTWYVFSGSTPRGWDCSGLVLWMYGNLGIELEHRASLQKYAGEFVSIPQVGDIVAFSYKGSKSAYHVGIWVGPDLMLHSGGKEGQKTEFRPISSFGGDYSDVTYTRLLETE